MKNVILGLAVLVFASMARTQSSTELVGEQQQLQLYSAFWPNLHNVLWAEAWTRRPISNGERSPAGVLPEPLAAGLTAAERTTWETALTYYDRYIADLHPLFDPRSRSIRVALVAAGSELPATGLAPDHRRVLTEAAAVYRKYWWPDHDHANREWIARTISSVTALSPDVPQRLARLYGTPWFNRPVRVDVVRVSSREGAFTSNDPTPGHITMSSSGSGNQGWGAAEVLLHEASHLLFLPVMAAFGAELQAQGKDVRTGPPESWNANIWHVALFYSTGEVVRQSLASRDISYEPYAYRTGLFDRAWPHLKSPVEVYWKAFVDGEISQEEAIKQIVCALK